MAARKASGPGGVAQLAQILDQNGAGGRGRRSTLSRWLRTHHDAFAAMLADKEPSWDELATALAAMGLRDGDNKPPTAERARKAWWDVRQATAAGAAKRKAATASPPLAPGEIAPGVQAAGASPLAPDRSRVSVPRPRQSLDLRPATPLEEQPPVAGPSLTPWPTTASTLAAPEGAGTAAADLQRLHEQMNAGRLPLPKVVR